MGRNSELFPRKMHLSAVQLYCCPWDICKCHLLFGQESHINGVKGLRTPHNVTAKCRIANRCGPWRTALKNHFKQLKLEPDNAVVAAWSFCKVKRRGWLSLDFFLKVVLMVLTFILSQL